MLFSLPPLLPHVNESSRLQSGPRASPVDPRLSQRAHEPLQRRHEPLQRPQLNHIAKETNNNHFFSTNFHQTSLSSPLAGGHLNRTLNAIINVCITSSTLLKHHSRRRAAAASGRCCFIRNEGHELETPTTTSTKTFSTSRDPSILTSTSTPSTRLCSLPSVQPHPTFEWVKTEQLISA